MDTPPPSSQKKGLGPLGWVGIGCAGIVGLGIIGLVIASFFFKDTFKDFTKNPTRAAASMVVKMGVAEMVVEDDANSRYTIKVKDSGKLITFYWSKKKGGPAQVDGDFSAIPADDMGLPPGSGGAATPSPAP